MPGEPILWTCLDGFLQIQIRNEHTVMMADTIREYRPRTQVRKQIADNGK